MSVVQQQHYPLELYSSPTWATMTAAYNNPDILAVYILLELEK